MSARDKVYEWMDRSCDGPDDRVRVVSLLDHLEAEIREQAAEEIRAADFGDPWLVGYGQQYAADLIDTKPKENGS